MKGLSVSEVPILNISLLAQIWWQRIALRWLLQPNDTSALPF